MRRHALLLSTLLVATACPSDDESATNAGASSESGNADSSTTVTTTSPETTLETSSSPTTTADTTCDDGCASSSGPPATESGSSSDASSSEGSSTAREESSSEGPTSVCGNGVIEGAEECDDSGESASCNVNCTTSMCGDAIFNATAGEECDVGGESFGCDVDCTDVVCGDGLVNASHAEECDDGGQTATCDGDCTPVSCGDGFQNVLALESCDDGNNDSDDGCSSTCVIEGDFGGVCRVVDGTQWCFDNDNCGQACEDVCTSIGLTIADDDAAWFAAQDTAPECQAISDAFGIVAPIDFGDHPLGCLEDSGFDDLTGGGLTGGLLCSSDPTCPTSHRNDMDGIGGNCDLPDARRSVCPCVGAFCGNGVVEDGEICDDGNDVDNDGCTTECVELPPTCVSANGYLWCFDNDACGEACNDVCSSLGLSLDIGDDEWFAAQDSPEECQVISDALGMAAPIQFSGWTYGCLMDDGLGDTVGGGLTGALYCSSYDGCPGEHRTNMDGLDVPCGPGARRSICPCN